MKGLSILATAGAALLVLGSVSANSARAAILNFETDDDGNALVAGDGTIISDQWADWGVNLSNEEGNRPLILFNSSCGPDFLGVSCTGGDTDLASGPSFGTAPLGNVLIVQESANLNIPDDNASGGLITFTFDKAVSIDTVGILDFDELKDSRGEGYIRAFTDDTNFIELAMSSDGTLLNEGFPGDNSLREYDFGLTGVTKLEVDFSGSGAVAYLDFTSIETNPNEDPEEVPEPASILGLLAIAAFGATGVLKRQK